MTEVKNKKTNGGKGSGGGSLKEYNFLRDTLLPACAIFCVAVFIFFLVAMGVGLNVTETKTEVTVVYDNQTGINDVDTPAPSPDALPVQTLLGILLFCISLVALGELFRLDYSRLTLRMTHFALTVLSFLIFVLVLPGYIGEAGAPAAIVDCAAVAVFYFILLGLKRLIMMIKPLRSEAVSKAVAFLLPVFGVFTVMVFAVSFFNLITQAPVIIKEVLEEVWEESDRLRTTYIRVATPLAPTLQNYIRYLFSGIVFVIGLSIMKMNLHTVAKWALNFTVITAGYIGIWIVGMDYFRMMKKNLLPAIIVYLAVYLVTLITVSVIHAVKRRNSEDDEEYEAQFRPGSVSRSSEKDE